MVEILPRYSNIKIEAPIIHGVLAVLIRISAGERPGEILRRCSGLYWLKYCRVK